MTKSTSEADVIINGARLDPGRVCALRVAVSSFRQQMLEPDALGSDACGRELAAAYAASLAQVEALLVPAMKEHPEPWLCPQCRQQNMAKNVRCFLCAKPREVTP